MTDTSVPDETTQTVSWPQSTPEAAPVASAPVTRREWAAKLLDHLGFSHSAEKIDALIAHMAHVDTQAAHNPLGLTEPAPGGVPHDAAGTVAYPDETSGLAAAQVVLETQAPQLHALLADETGGSATSYVNSGDLAALGTTNAQKELESLRSGDPDGLADSPVGTTQPEPAPEEPAPPA